jgi:hypothetical protein
MGRPQALDRLVALATTRPGLSLDNLEQTQNIQDVIDTRLGSRDMGDQDSAPVELWTAQVVPVLIGG